MRIRSLGHVVLRVRDLDRAKSFYHGLLGLPISARSDDWSMIFFSLGQHHDFAVTAVGEAALPPETSQVGLDHIAFKLAGHLDALRDAKAHLESNGVKVLSMDHVVTKSIYFQDPDGNLVELYVDGTDAWREKPELILSEGGPLDL